MGYGELFLQREATKRTCSFLVLIEIFGQVILIFDKTHKK